MPHLRPDGYLETLQAPTRRGVLGGAAGGGFALAALPVAASTIQTSAAGLVVEEITYPVGDDQTPAYTARPVGDGPFPAIILVSEIFGVHAYIQDVARRLAHAGYFCIAPDYFYRAGNPANMSDFNEILKIVATATYPQILADTDGAVGVCANSPYANSNALGITGFCWGGGVTWMYAAHEPRIKAGIAWYGRIKGHPDATEKRPYPIDIAGDLKAPVLGLYAGQDTGIPIADVEEMRAALLTAGNTDSQIHIYPGAAHGFHADYRKSYDQSAAQDGWARCLAWLKQNGVG